MSYSASDHGEAVVPCHDDRRMMAPTGHTDEGGRMSASRDEADAGWRLSDSHG
jgi:hypothetical protein